MLKAARLLNPETPEARCVRDISSLHIPDVSDSEKKGGDLGHLSRESQI